MDPVEILDISRDAIFVLLLACGPLLLVALGVGLVISLFQALTQMQEATISFVPKIAAVFLALVLLLPFIGGKLKDFNDELMNKIINIK